MGKTTSCGRSTTSAAIAATSWCGTTSQGGGAGHLPAVHLQSTTPGGSAPRRPGPFVQEEEFFGLDKEPVRAGAGALLRGMGGLHLRQLRRQGRAARDYLGPDGQGPEGYPFHEMTEVYSYKAEIGSNWKLFIDAFAEFYHAPMLHREPGGEGGREAAGSVRGAALCAARPHSMISSWGMARPRTSTWSSPSSRVLHSGLFGPWDRPDIEGLDLAAAASNPAAQSSGASTRYEFFPNFAADLGAGLVPDLPLLAHRGEQPSSKQACTSCRRRMHASGWPRNWRPSRSRSTHCRMPTPWRPRR